MVTDSCLILLVTWEYQMKEILSSLIICWPCFISLAPMWRHTVFTTTEVHTSHVVCGQHTNNSLNQKHFRKQKELSVSSICLLFPLITSQFTLTNRLMQETGNKGTEHSLYWNSQGAVTTQVTSAQSWSHASWESHIPQKTQQSRRYLFCSCQPLKGITGKHRLRGHCQILAVHQKQDMEPTRTVTLVHKLIFAVQCLLTLRDSSSGADFPGFLELTHWSPDTGASGPQTCPVPERLQWGHRPSAGARGELVGQPHHV